MMYGLYTAAGLLAALCAYWLLRRRPHALFVLAYEKAGIPPHGSRLKKEWFSAPQFEQTLIWLRTHGFTPVSLEKLASGTKLPQKSVLLAFMGGYQSFFTDIFPLLKQHKTPAAIFLPPDLAGAYNAWQNPHLEAWQNLLTLQQVKELQKSGLISLGALSLSGEDLTLIPAESAVCLLKESLFRMETQLKITPAGFAFWPAEKFDAKKAARLLPNGFKLPILTPLPGVNKTVGKKVFLKTLYPARNPFSVRYALWKRR